MTKREDEELDLDAIEERAARATPGPWVLEGDAPDRRGHEAIMVTGEKRNEHGYRPFPSAHCYGPKADTIFIAAAREDVPRLVARVRELKARLPEGMKECAILFKQCPVGHGWLTALNWVEHGCPTCALRKVEAERDEARAQVAVLRAALTACKNLTRHQEWAKGEVGEIGRMVGQTVDDALRAPGGGQ
jgi:hypothetical protein